MKRIIALVLILCSLSTFAAADTDPAVGMWYIMLDFSVYPEFRQNAGDMDCYFSVMYFLEDGVIISLTNSITGKEQTPQCGSSGKWEKAEDSYKYSLIGSGEGTFTIEGDEMYLYSEDSKMTMHLRRIVPFNPYKDYSY